MTTQRDINRLDSRDAVHFCAATVSARNWMQAAYPRLFEPFSEVISFHRTAQEQDIAKFLADAAQCGLCVNDVSYQ